MSSIGQLRRSEISSYTTNLAYTFTSEENSNSIMTFYDKCVKLTKTTFSSSYSYYLKFTVAQLVDSVQKFNVILRNDSSETDQTQTVRTFSVKSGNSTTTFELIFTPNSTYNQIMFELVRDAVDYRMTNDEGTNGRLMTITMGQLSSITNVISTYLASKYDLSELIKIGIQGPPGLMFTLNGEEMRIGKTGIYELYYDEVVITYIGFVIKNSEFTQDGKDYFIMDFKY